MSSSSGALTRGARHLRHVVGPLGYSSPSERSVPSFPIGRRMSALLVIAAAGVLWLVTLPASPPPTYDTQWQLLWGEQLSRGELPHYAVGPTVHPLIVFLGGALSFVGFGHDGVVDQGVRALTALSLVSIAAMCALIAYRVAGSAAALLVAIVVLSRPFIFEFAFVSYFDVIFVALCLGGFLAARADCSAWALCLLTAAGLIRPEAWLFAAVLAGVAWWRGSRRITLVALALAAPVIWLCFDWIVVGDPIYSFTNTSAAAAGLGRDRGPLDAALLAPVRAGQLVGVEVAVLILMGFALAWHRRKTSREASWLLTVSVIGFGSYFAVNGLGTSILSRYLLFPTIATMPFIAFLMVGLADGTPTAGRSRRLSRGLAVIAAGVCVIASGLGIKEISTLIPVGRQEARDDDAVRAAAGRLAGCRAVLANDFYVVAVVARELNVSPDLVRLTVDGRASRPPRTELIGTGRRTAESAGSILVRGGCAR
jgi:hypothetical protein